MGNCSCQAAACSAAHDQGRQGTCYAFAVATVIHATLVRNSPFQLCESHASIRQRLIHEYGVHGADSTRALEEECKRQGFKCRELSTPEAAEAAVLKHQRQLIRIRMTDRQWRFLESFFAKGANLKKPISAADLPVQAFGEETSGHGCVIVGANAGGMYWKVKNSWGEGFCDEGFFRFSYDLVTKVTIRYFDCWDPKHEG